MKQGDDTGLPHRLVEFFARHFASVPLISIGGRWLLILLRIRGETWKDEFALVGAAVGDILRVLFQPWKLRNPWAGPALRLRTVTGIRFHTRPRSDDLYFMMPMRERDVERFIRDALERSKRHGWTFADVGANVGYYTILACKMGVPTLAIEAHPETYRVLEKNLSLNGCDNVRTVPRAVWRESGLRVRIVSPEAQFGMAHIDPEETGEVETVTLDELLAPYDRIGLVKLDVEGAEVAALEGAHETLRRAQFVVLEALEEGTRRQVQEILRSHDFALRPSRFSSYILAEKIP